MVHSSCLTDFAALELLLHVLFYVYNDTGLHVVAPGNQDASYQSMYYLMYKTILACIL